MTWHLSYSPSATRDLRKLGSETACRIMGALDALAATGNGHLKKLKGVHPPEWRLRVGDYRAGLALDNQTQTIEVLYARHRREAYR
ncbi:MAG: type II toxin-antitoxin system RelE/ParE family toxin [Candidatus Sericytochromatia bacterium]|nr:type II toxin-antitoxin system RelE/ParE family toxin [Candidatus Sericytochromatia bacterium]